MTESWIPDDVDVSEPSSARMYDYYLGGAHNFAVDRKAADRVLEAMPFTAVGAQTNRAWLRRAVRFLVEAGVRQFLDLGSGTPTVGNVHEIAQDIDPRVRVVYVDVDPVATAHARRLLTGNDQAWAVNADVRDVAGVLEQAREQLDPGEPVALLASAVLHFIPDSDRPGELLDGYFAGLPEGSYLALSHMSPIGRPADEIKQFTDAYAQTPNPVTLRDRDAIAALLSGVELVEPGLVRLPFWRPDDTPRPEDENFPGYAAVGAVRTRG